MNKILKNEYDLEFDAIEKIKNAIFIKFLLSSNKFGNIFISNRLKAYFNVNPQWIEYIRFIHWSEDVCLRIIETCNEKQFGHSMITAKVELCMNDYIYENIQDLLCDKYGESSLLMEYLSECKNISLRTQKYALEFSKSNNNIFILVRLARNENIDISIQEEIASMDVPCVNLCLCHNLNVPQSIKNKVKNNVSEHYDFG